MAKQDKTNGKDKDFTPDAKKKKLSQKEKVQQFLDYHNKKIKDAKNIVIGDKVAPCYDMIINTSGGVLVLPDFYALSINPESEKTFYLTPGEGLNLLTKFDIKHINRNRQGLETAAKMPGVYGFNAITFVEDLDEEFPVPLRKQTAYEKGLEEKEKFGTAKIPLPANEYDVLLRKDIEKEEKRNEKLNQESKMKVGGDRKTRSEIEQEEIDKMK